ncbi:tripartite tricarboxylate transporter substrate binding protein [Roseomonas xinghualingensis]|uniref:tripartite tricarboxylate transporter substrate binding protein n=1 Tax=Roseomonas xinghualingensis TaxID=2986475 RepID=UPI0021F22329|nr:tripartite tricarboxylate transporter substrate binding protein [Roseomonas sp. SXEYE001]MCV4209716.1 tripartite tricarboxylate transporter substrate binding protein [Roseomonas sp. SXEYE001]
MRGNKKPLSPPDAMAAHPSTGPLPRRAIASAAAALLAAPRLAGAQGRFPDRPIRLIVPWPPGGSADAQLRSLGEIAQHTLGQPVIIENRPGAGGTIHAPYLAREARPDGYTIGQMHLSVIRRTFMVRNAQWDPVADFTPIIGLTGWLFGVAIRTDNPIRNWADYLARARANPGRVTYSSSGIATTNHLAMEEIAQKEKVELTHVPFRGANEGVTAVLGGQVESIADSSTWSPNVEAGQMRLLCVWSAERAPRFPDVPTLKELGYDMVVTSPYGLAGPKGMDPGVVRVLHDAFRQALFDPRNVQVRSQFDMPLEYRSTEEYREFIIRRAEYEREMIQKLNLRIE